jgi:hypothetical protein
LNRRDRSPGVSNTLRRISQLFSEGDLDKLLLMVVTNENLLFDVQEVLREARAAALTIMMEREATEALEATTKGTIDFGTKTIVWNEDRILSEVVPLLDPDEAKEIVISEDVQKVEHVFKVNTVKLNALARRRKGALERAVNEAKTESYNTAPRLKAELRESQIKGEDDD